MTKTRNAAPYLLIHVHTYIGRAALKKLNLPATPKHMQLFIEGASDSQINQAADRLAKQICRDHKL